MTGLVAGPAPAWQVTTLDGAPGPAVNDYAGQHVLVLFFNVGCLGCVSRGLPFAQQIASAYPELSVVVIHSDFGSLPTTPERVREVLPEDPPAFTLLNDDGHETYDRYEAEGTPHWALIAPDGTVSKSIFGSMPNAIQRLTYSLEELFPDPA